MPDDSVDLGRLILPPGIEPGRLMSAVQASGYPLQTVVARRLDETFSVSEEWGFVDRTTKERRSLDVFAFKKLGATSTELEPCLALLVECKRSELPFVFFSAAIPRVPKGFPSILGLARSKITIEGPTIGNSTRVREMPIADAMEFSAFSFVSEPPLAVTFSRIERKGKDYCLSGSVPYNNVVLPLASALEHYGATRVSPDQKQPCFYPTLAICMCVIDAPMVIAGGTPERPELASTSWVRLVHEEAVLVGSLWQRKHYYIDVVQKSYLDVYLEQALQPFADAVATRMCERKDVLFSTRGKVENIDNWTWDGVCAL